MAYVVEDHALPLVKVQATFRTGAFRERSGRDRSRGADRRDDAPGRHRDAHPRGVRREGRLPRRDRLELGRADFGASASLDVITPALAEALDLFFDMLRKPRFDEARLTVEKSTALEEMKQRNDDAGDIVGREWGFLLARRDALRVAPHDAVPSLDGDHARRPRRRSTAGPTGPEHLVVAVSGDVDTATILADLEQAARRLEGRQPRPGLAARRTGVHPAARPATTSRRTSRRAR